MASSLGSGFASSTTSTASAACSQLWGGQVRRPDFARCLPAGRSKIVRASLSENVRISLLQALSTQAASRTQQVVEQIAKEAVKYVNPKRGDARSLEEALMTVPDLETIPYRVLRRGREYEIREVESYVLAETSMPGSRGFDFLGSSQGFNTLADYLFGKNKRREKMEMTTPVIVRGSGRGERMEMTTPVISRQAGDRSEWKMSFVIPSKYDESNLPVPEDSRVKTRRVPARIVAAVAFSGFVTDDEVLRRERALRKALERDNGVRVTNFAVPEVAQYNDPFTPPFLRRNEIFLEVELKD